MTTVTKLNTMLILVGFHLAGCGQSLEPSSAGRMWAEEHSRTRLSNHNPSMIAAQISSIREEAGYRIYVNGKSRAYVSLQESSNAIVTSVTRDGSVAAIIPDHDTHHGVSLLILDVASGEIHRLVQGPVTSAVFSESGQDLAYVLATEAGGVVQFGTSTSPGRTVGMLEGRHVSLLGFSSDGQSLNVLIHPNHQDDRTYGLSLVQMRISDGRTDVILSSESGKCQRYSDFRQIRINGQQMLSDISSGNKLCVGSSMLELRTTDGIIAKSFHPSSDYAIRAATWSTDGNQVAYIAQKCTSKTAVISDPDSAITAQELDTGVFVSSPENGRTIRVVAGIPNAELVGFQDGLLRFAADREGLTSVDSNAIDVNNSPIVMAQRLFQDSIKPSVSSLLAVDNRAVHIHQLYDTRDEFDGRGSCGPTTAVMTMATYQLGEWGLSVKYGGTHWSPYGRYVTDSYSYSGTSFNHTEPDYSNNGAWAGAHGWVYSYCCGAVWADMLSYLNRHTGWAKQHSWDAAWIRSELDRGQLIAASGKMTSAGHIVLIKGYTTDGKWIVHDPFGPSTSGGPGGADQVYTTAYLKPSVVWSN